MNKSSWLCSTLLLASTMSCNAAQTQSGISKPAAVPNVALEVGLADQAHQSPQLSLWSANFSTRLGRVARRSHIGIEVVVPANSPAHMAQAIEAEVALHRSPPQKVTLRRVNAQGTHFRGTVAITKPGKVVVSYGSGATRQTQRLYVRWPVGLVSNLKQGPTGSRTC